MSPKNKYTNLDYLKELAKGDEKFIKEMVGIFLTENPHEIMQLEQAIQETNYERIQSVSHHMKSTISFVGLDLILGKDLSAIEQLATDKKELQTILSLFEQVKLICKGAVEELSE